MPPWADTKPGCPPDFETTVRAYWKMVYWHVLRKSRGRYADAEDLTQAFFCYLLEKNRLARFVPERGCLSTFIIHCLKGFLRDQWKRELSRRRGGGRRTVSLENSSRAGEAGTELSGDGGPEAVLQRGIESALVASAVRDLREIYRSEGRELYYRVFEAYEWKAAPDVSYARVAAEWGISSAEMTRYLSHVRRRLRDLVRKRVGEPVAPS